MAGCAPKASRRCRHQVLKSRLALMMCGAVGGSGKGNGDGKWDGAAARAGIGLVGTCRQLHLVAVWIVFYVGDKVEGRVGLVLDWFWYWFWFRLWMGE